MYSSAPFIIQPADDLISQHPALKQLSHQLALKYVHQELVTDNDLQIIGSQLWRALDCTEAYDKACQKAGMAILPLIILSDQAALQQLPWETLYHPEKHFMGKDVAFSLSRQIVSKEHQPTAFPPEKGPLKILLFTSLTDDQARLDIEKEQEQVQEALLPWISRGQVQLEMPNDGRFSSFQQVLKQYQPHLVFLSGHGKFYDKDLIAKQTEDYATFAFEDETSTNSKEIEAKTLATAFIGTAVQAVVLSACQSGKSASDKLSTGLMQQLAIQGITHVIGMRESIFDRAGTLFAREFCDQIAQQARIDLALQAARRAITQPLKDPADSMAAELSYGQWCLPLLISQDPARALIDWQFEAQKPTFSSETLTLQNIPLAQHFIGRRKEQRELITALQSRQQTQLLITGAGGQGKTALAGQLAQTLQQQGWTILAWSAQPENQW
ncbi:MAG: CHAT domain-containing protein, partial [Cocleimonas sp.]|nr:CHAT domain-containing protein [Cocleimonas sp.]